MDLGYWIMYQGTVWIMTLGPGSCRAPAPEHHGTSPWCPGATVAAPWTWHCPRTLTVGAGYGGRDVGGGDVGETQKTPRPVFHSPRAGGRLPIDQAEVAGASAAQCLPLELLPVIPKP